MLNILCALLLLRSQAHSQTTFDPQTQAVARLLDGRPQLLVSEYLLCRSLKVFNPEVASVERIVIERIQNQDFLFFDCSPRDPASGYWSIGIRLVPNGQGDFTLDAQMLTCKGEACARCSRASCLCEADEPGQTGACSSSIKQGAALAKISSDGN